MTLLGRKPKHKETGKASVQPPVFQSVSHPAASRTTVNLSSNPQFSSVLPSKYNPADFQWSGPPETLYRQPASVSASQPNLPHRKIIPHRQKPKRQNQNVQTNQSSGNPQAVPRNSGPLQDARKQVSRSVTAPPGQPRGTEAGGLHDLTTHYMNRGAALYDQISTRFNEVITSMDEQVFTGDERDLHIQHSIAPAPFTTSRDQPSNPISADLPSSKNHFAKVWQYANSRLPPHLPPLKLYMPTYPLLCLAAQYSEKAYARPPASSTSPLPSHPPQQPQRPQTQLIPADWRRGTKAMVLSAVARDDLHTLVVAIRGSQSFLDWAVNFRPAPTPPTGFLADGGNLCHAGFLSVARAMVAPIAERLRTLVAENPSRRQYSLLLCGHSAGGAVAALLFAHMLAGEASGVASELVELAPFLRRVHCVTFGAPPVSLLPLQKPEGERWRKSLFFGFVNEGDPVVRADRQVVGSLLRLYASPAPAERVMMEESSVSGQKKLDPKAKDGEKSKGAKGMGKGKAVESPMPVWRLPPSTLSNAGRLVLLRTEKKANGEERVKACITTDEQLRDAVFGDPICHSMKLYAQRIEELATQAVTVRMP